MLVYLARYRRLSLADRGMLVLSTPTKNAECESFDS